MEVSNVDSMRRWHVATRVPDRLRTEFVAGNAKFVVFVCRVANCAVRAECRWNVYRDYGDYLRMQLDRCFRCVVDCDHFWVVRHDDRHHHLLGAREFRSHSAWHHCRADAWRFVRVGDRDPGRREPVIVAKWSTTVDADEPRYDAFRDAEGRVQQSPDARSGGGRIFPFNRGNLAAATPQGPGPKRTPSETMSGHVRAATRSTCRPSASQISTRRSSSSDRRPAARVSASSPEGT
jgi:hypothetical protein